jgi:hypothetical protein
VAEGLHLKQVLRPADAARPTWQDLKPSPALSIVKKGPKSFVGRKFGAPVTYGVDAEIVKALAKALEAECALLKLVAPGVGGASRPAKAPGAERTSVKVAMPVPLCPLPYAPSRRPRETGRDSSPAGGSSGSGTGMRRRGRAPTRKYASQCLSLYASPCPFMPPFMPRRRGRSMPRNACPFMPPQVNSLPAMPVPLRPHK